MASEIRRFNTRSASFGVLPLGLLAEEQIAAVAVVPDLGDGDHVDGVFELQLQEGLSPASAAAHLRLLMLSVAEQ